MINAKTLPYLAIAMMVIGCILSIIAMATDSWGKLEPTTAGGYLHSRSISGHWGLFKVCLKMVTTQEIKNECKSLDNYPEYWNASLAFEILAFICSLLAVPFWCVWVFWKRETDFPWPKILKATTVTFICLTAFWHAVAVSVWNAKDEGPPEVRRYAITTGFSWGFAIFCIIWELLVMVPMQLSLPAYKRNRLIKKQPTHPLFRPDPEGGGIVINPQDGNAPASLFNPGIETDDNTPSFITKPTMIGSTGTFLDSLPDERNVYVYDEDEGAIKPQTVSRTAGKQTAQMFGNTWGKQPAQKQKSRLQQLKETWGKRGSFKFGFGTKSKADNLAQSGSRSKITGRPLKKTEPSGYQVDNSAPLFVKSLWNTHFKKDEIKDEYKVESENRISSKWEKDDTHEADTPEKPKFVFTTEQPGRNNYDDNASSEEEEEKNIGSDEDENEENVYNMPSSSEDEAEIVTVPNPNITFEKKVIERKNFNVANDDENDEEPTQDEIPSHTPASNFSFTKKVVERKNYNLSSDDDDDDNTEIKPTKRQAPDIPVHREPDYPPSGVSSSVLDEMYTYEYDTGFDPPHSHKVPEDEPAVNPLHLVPNIKLQLDMSDGPSESDDTYEQSKWAKPYDFKGESTTDTKDKHNYENFAYISDMDDNENNVTEI